MPRSALCVGAALLALACGGTTANGSPAASDAAPAASVARAQPPAGGASPESAPPPAATAAPTTADTATKPAPQTPPAAPVAAPVPGSPDEVRRVSVTEANGLREQERAVILDVRDKGSYDANHVAGALHIPVDSLIARMDELPRDKPIITYCA